MTKFHTILIFVCFLISSISLGQENGKSKHIRKNIKANLEIGIKSSFGTAYRFLRNQSSISRQVVEKRNITENHSFSTINEIVFSISNSHVNFMKFNFSMGQNHILTQGKVYHFNYYFDNISDDSKAFLTTYSKMILSNSLEFFYGKNKHFGGIELGAFYQFQNIHNGNNISPFISLKYSYKISPIASICFGYYFTSQVLNNHFHDSYFYHYNDNSTGNSHLSFQKAELERIWQSGLSLSIHFNLKKSSQP